MKLKRERVENLKGGEPLAGVVVVRNLLLRRDLFALPDVKDADLVVPADRDDVVTRNARERRRRHRLRVTQERNDRRHALGLRPEVEDAALALRVRRDEEVTLDRMERRHSSRDPLVDLIISDPGAVAHAGVHLNKTKRMAKNEASHGPQL